MRWGFWRWHLLGTRASTRLGHTGGTQTLRWGSHVSLSSSSAWRAPRAVKCFCHISQHERGWNAHHECISKFRQPAQLQLAMCGALNQNFSYKFPLCFRVARTSGKLYGTRSRLSSAASASCLLQLPLGIVPVMGLRRFPVRVRDTCLCRLLSLGVAWLRPRVPT